MLHLNKNSLYEKVARNRFKNRQSFTIYSAIRQKLEVQLHVPLKKSSCSSEIINFGLPRVSFLRTGASYE